MSDSSENFSFKSLPRSHIAAAFILLGFAALMVWDQLFWWANNEDYSFGFLVPFFVGYVLYSRWPVVRSYLFRGAAPEEEPAPASSPQSVTRTLEWVAVVGFLGSLMLFGIGMLIRMATGPQNPASLAVAMSFAGLLLSSVFIFSKETVDGKRMSLGARFSLTLLFVFPALIWLLSAPMVAVLDNKIRVFLMNKVTVVVFGVFDFMGYELERRGNVLILPEGSVGVEEACSGIRSLTGCLFAGSFFGAVFLKQFWKKALMVALAMGLAVLMNLIRSMFLTIWSYHYGPNAIDAEWSLPVIGDIGTVHDVTGLLIMVATCFGLMCFLPIFNYKLPEFDDDFEEGVQPHAGGAPKDD
ncbi:exosortase [Coraliomargarita sinensis]|uniref:Exosortase n=1 Tax=Coraliomargarita sinensis TaxID=2174842 RepID=A0A317ZJ57_9BACT|nr:exosortase/archaeosortase family protein [Coraliomargarita sinensis]PXA03928.1 exosortase [Coraliomargarita sinensis]